MARVRDFVTAAAAARAQVQARVFVTAQDPRVADAVSKFMVTQVGTGLPMPPCVTVVVQNSGETGGRLPEVFFRRSFVVSIRDRSSSSVRFQKSYEGPEGEHFRESKTRTCHTRSP
jgi:hypothetical protein